MPKRIYKQRKFSPASRAVIARAITILEEYEAQGYDLTLRQLYYQFVARGLIPNRDSEYKKLGSIVNDARLAGLIDWDHIVDRTRNLKDQPHWDDPADVIEASTKWFKTDLWADQPFRLEVWIEKDALIGVIESVCRELDVPYFSCRGYTSQSEAWAASQRLLHHVKDGQRVRILHLGDHDPSGVDMTRDVWERLSNFMVLDHWRGKLPGSAEGNDLDPSVAYILGSDDAPRDAFFAVDRLALNWDQIEQYEPPPNPAKITDSRARAYMEEHGDESWELDALEPTVLGALIRNAVDGYIDGPKFDAAVEREQGFIGRLREVSRRWPEIEELLGS